jgi:hypothetical protein
MIQNTFPELPLAGVMTSASSLGKPPRPGVSDESNFKCLQSLSSSDARAGSNDSICDGKTATGGSAIRAGAFQCARRAI